MSSFLFSDCDPYLNFAGCPNRQDFNVLNQLFIGFYSLSVLGYSTYIVHTLFIRRATAEQCKKDDLLIGSTCGVVSLSIMVTFLANGLQVATTDAAMESLVRTSLYLEWAHTTTSGLGLGALTAYFIKMTGSKDLYGGNQAIINRLKIFRVCIALTLLVFNILLSTTGFVSIGNFMAIRTTMYLVATFIVGVINPTIYIHYAKKLLNGMREVEKHSRMDKEGQLRIRTMKMVLFGVPIGTAWPFTLFYIFQVIIRFLPISSKIQFYFQIPLYTIKWFSHTWLIVIIVHKISSYNRQQSKKLPSLPTSNADILLSS
ncbi:hypothetical protein HDU91_006640 [Kappamyces sp. JEL0680]|nr:hypothetical protein HDU91_006640 [Kappamyces sp. JEL0680]